MLLLFVVACCLVRLVVGDRWCRCVWLVVLLCVACFCLLNSVVACWSAMLFVVVCCCCVLSFVVVCCCLFCGLLLFACVVVVCLPF